MQYKRNAWRKRDYDVAKIMEWDTGTTLPRLINLSLHSLLRLGEKLMSFFYIQNLNHLL